MFFKEALLYEELSHRRVQCHLCGHRCVIPEGELGVCHVRQNSGGVLQSLVYGSAISANVDPIEKKPLYHFNPGSQAYSIATMGCNFKCKWCQNWEMAQGPRHQGLAEVRQTTPEEVVAAAQATGSESIAYTYTEPTVFFEYCYDIARLARAAGIANVFVTNGYMTPEMLAMLHPYLDAANVDLKAFRKSTYHRLVGASLGPVLESMKLLKKYGVWLEVTTLVIPGLNDDREELREIAEFIAGELGVETPWHISRFFPHYQMANTPATPAEIMQTAYELGKEAGLDYVYLGNVGGESNTACPACDEILVRRQGYRIEKNNIREGICANCRQAIAGVWG